jgi:hypothetical protein
MYHFFFFEMKGILSQPYTHDTFGLDWKKNNNNKTTAVKIVWGKAGVIQRVEDSDPSTCHTLLMST